MTLSNLICDTSDVLMHFHIIAFNYTSMGSHKTTLRFALYIHSEYAKAMPHEEHTC